MNFIQTRLLPFGKEISTGLPLRYIVVETCISMVINAAAATLPFLGAYAASSPRSLHAVAVSLSPQIILGATMSVLGPSLLTRWRQSRARSSEVKFAARPTLGRIVLMAAVSALAFAVTVLACIGLALPRMVGEHIGWVTQIELSATQGILAAALLTPLALCSLFGGDKQ